MGAYLTTPITKKETEEDEDTYLRVASASMQGWRMAQEVIDAYLTAVIWGNFVKWGETTRNPYRKGLFSSFPVDANRNVMNQTWAIYQRSCGKTCLLSALPIGTQLYFVWHKRCKLK